MAAPQLEGDAAKAVAHRGSHMQIIAAAGSGKTEVVSQRVAGLLADGVAPRGIVAFTFTEKASAELKDRITQRVEERLGKSALDLLSGLFVGTIHSYCFRLLQQYVPRYEAYDVLDENQLTAFLAREANRLELRQLDPNNRLFASIAAFLKNVDITENELLDADAMPEPFRTVLTSYLDTLERYHLLTYGQQIVRTVDELEGTELRKTVHADLRHLIVDEYQDINPAQERLIQLLTGPELELCVVGDDDQAIYQWRGSDVTNIVDFSTRYPDVATYSITTNRRSRPQIIKRANTFALTIAPRLPKTMGTYRPPGEVPEVIAWSGETEADEAGWITSMIDDLHEQGVPYRDMAVLVRTSAAYPQLIANFATFDIPVQPGGRTGLFEQQEAVTLGKVISWISSMDWRQGRTPAVPVSDESLRADLQRVFALDDGATATTMTFLRQWKAEVPKTSRVANLIGELYQLLGELGVSRWDTTSTGQINRLGTLARFSALLADYESVRRRARPDADVEGEQVGGQDRGEWYYKNLAIHITNYASGEYEGFDGEPDLALDAVELTTVHRAKGLEWPIVFVPSLTKRRFPSARAGQVQKWLVPRDAFVAARYEGSDADERRLFYVAITRARDWVSLSRHERVTTKASGASPYWLENQDLEIDPAHAKLPSGQATVAESDDPVTVSYSEMASFLDCAQAYRLRSLLGFQPRLAPELGYGKAVHHVLRTIAETSRADGTVPSSDDLASILDANFFLPTANKAAHRQLKEAARRLVTEYTTTHSDDLFRIWGRRDPSNCTWTVSLSQAERT
jgi:DNA helicase-2/ATP-dependent DNA helicase PcrA